MFDAAVFSRTSSRGPQTPLQAHYLPRYPIGAMSSNLESTAVFRARLEEKGIEMLLPRFKDRLNVTTLAELAFCTSFVPGVTPDAVFRAEVVEKVLDTTIEEEAKLVGYVRRLFFDAYVACTYETKQRLERKADDAPRKLDDVERRERRKTFLADPEM